MIPMEPVRDVMRRTMFNLHFIEEHQAPDGPFEVTQLVNSFLGALAHPWEHFRKELEQITLSEAEAQGWPGIYQERDTDKAPDSLGDLLRLMRNSIAHGNITFMPDDQNRIRAIRLWNENQKGRRTWGTILTVALMRDLLNRFVQLAEDLHKREHSEGERIA